MSVHHTRSAVICQQDTGRMTLTLHNSKSFIKSLKGIVYLKIILAKIACTDAYIKNTPKNIIWESLVTNFNIQALSLTCYL